MTPRCITNLLLMLVVQDNVSSIALLVCSGAYKIYPLQEDAVQLELVQPLPGVLQESCLLMLLLGAALPAQHQSKASTSCAIQWQQHLKLLGRVCLYAASCCDVAYAYLTSAMCASGQLSVGVARVMQTWAYQLTSAFLRSL